MATRKKLKRKYLIYLDKSIAALLASIDRINNVHDTYKIEESLILLTNAWELFAKGILIRDREKIYLADGRSITAEDAITKLVAKNYLTENQAQHIQQIISLRNSAMHSVLPDIPQEIVFHLMFYGVKFFKDIISGEFPTYKSKCSGNFLSISFDTFTTYADKLQKLISKARKRGTPEQELLWLLERGVRFKGGQYISQNKFEDEIKKLGRKKRLYHHLKISDFIRGADMVVVVPVQAPKGYTADINLRKSSNKAGAALPVMIKKTDLEEDYPYLTSEIARKINKGTNFVAKSAAVLMLKNNTTYHQAVRSSKSGKINRYSQKALDYLKDYLQKNPNYNPFSKS
jgi:hypothetical protein